MAFGTVSMLKRSAASLTATRMKLKGDSSYPTGGTSGLADLIATRIQQHRHIAHISVRAPGYTGHYDHDVDKLLIFQGSTEVANLADLSGVTFDVLVLSY